MLSEAEWIYERRKLFDVMYDHPEWRLQAYARAVQHDPKWVRKWVKRLTGQPAAATTAQSDPAGGACEGHGSGAA
jgi:hypothetical protein